jgi:hypothetical protein
LRLQPRNFIIISDSLAVNLKNFVTICHREVCLPNFQIWLQNFEAVTSKFNIERPSTSMASKTARPKILKIANCQIASNQCKSSKYWWQVAKKPDVLCSAILLE